MFNCKIFRHLFLAGFGALPVVAWTLFDAGLPATVSSIRHFMSPHPNGSLYYNLLESSPQSIARAVIGIVTSVFWASMLVLAAARLRAGQKTVTENCGRHLTWMSWILIVYLHLFAIGISILGFNRISRLGLEVRTRRVANTLTESADALFRKWPKHIETVVHIGRVAPVPKLTDRLFALDSPSALCFVEGVGTNIDRAPSGDAMLFSLSSSNTSGEINALIVLEHESVIVTDEWLRSLRVNSTKAATITRRLRLVTVYRLER